MNHFNKSKKLISNGPAPIAFISIKEHNFHTLILDLAQIEIDKAFKKSINSFHRLRWSPSGAFGIEMKRAAALWDAADDDSLTPLKAMKIGFVNKYICAVPRCLMPRKLQCCRLACQ